MGAIAMGHALGVAEARAAPCDEPDPHWLACEDFEGGDAGWAAWFQASPFVECLGCPDGMNDPARILLTDADAHEGTWSLHMPAEASAGYQGASLSFRTCAGDEQPGCTLQGHDRLHFRTFVKLAADHQYVHHFLAIGGTRPDGYWEGDGNAGCRPNGVRHAGTTVDFDDNRELFFYSYFPEMSCDAGGYCSGDYAQGICDQCAQKDMPCDNGLECCWGNHFRPEPPVVLPRGEWVCLEMMMELNTPTQADGRMAFWVNDELALEQTGMHWRDVPELQLNKAWLQHYIAEGDATQSNRIWFDDVVVGTERIGCSTDLPGGADGDTGSPGTTTGGGTGPSGGTANADSGGSGPSGTDVTGGGGASGDDTAGASDESDGCGCGFGSPEGSAGSGLLGLVVVPLVRRRRRRP